MKLDDRRLSRIIHLLAIAMAVAALSTFLPGMARLMGDDFTVGTSLSMSALFVGLPAMIGMVAWSDRSSPRTPLMSAFLVLCGLLAAYTMVFAVRSAVAVTSQQVLVFSIGALGVSIALAVAAAFIRDRGHVAPVSAG